MCVCVCIFVVCLYIFACSKLQLSSKSFVGVLHARTLQYPRMMLSDSKLLARLKEELAGMAAPLHKDAQVFQTKITEASERQEVGFFRRHHRCRPLFKRGSTGLPRFLAAQQGVYFVAVAESAMIHSRWLVLVREKAEPPPSPSPW